VLMATAQRSMLVPAVQRVHRAEARSCRCSGAHPAARTTTARATYLAIKVQNFMTFGSITVKPSPRLNLIIGPNGTGKSSIVCAIGIALAGEPRMLGRAADVRDFVQRGKERGMVHITLRGARAGECIAVERRMDVQNKSEWLLNGMPAKREDVRRVMKDLNIQVENLTQFLPQDRVCEFAGLSRERLLEETLKAVGDPS